MLKIIIFSFCLATALSAPGCVLYNNGTLPPSKAEGDRMIPRKYSDEWTGGIACPDFNDTESCCPQASNLASLDNFQKIRTAFGNQGGGCDICAANIERFFCYFACSPNQTEFMDFNNYTKTMVWNTTSNQLEEMEVTSVNVRYDAGQGCDLFQSCSKISFLTEISAGGSAQGFFTFLFDRGIQDSAIMVNLTIVNEKGLKFKTPPTSCNRTFPDGKDDSGYEVPGNCTCNYCQDSCSPLVMSPYGALLDGFKGGNVILAYLFAALLTLGITFLRGFKKKRTALTPSYQRDLTESSLVGN